MSTLTELLQQLESKPRDPRLLAKLGELHHRRGELALAAEVFRRLAEVYAADQFFLKAVAVAKQCNRATRSSCTKRRLEQPADAAGYLRSAAEICRLEGRAGEAGALEARLASMKAVNRIRRAPSPARDSLLTPRAP